MHFYTSININYLPKARILAKSVKKFCPDSKFSLVFSDVMPQEIEPQKEPFDEIITIDNLGLPVSNLNFWISQRMNSIRACAKEIVEKEIIFA